tara:strand:+ start:3389 stop:3832 length:444 start_codon:yes stop_codon:yes gene_type:complete
LGHNENTKCARVYFLKDSSGKLYIPEKKMISGKNCYDTANELLNECLSLDRSKPFNIDLCGCVDGPDRYPGKSEHFLSLVFRLDIDIDPSYLNKKFYPLTPEEIFECMEKGDISKDHPIIFAISLYGKQYQKELFDPYIHPDAQEQV